MNFERFLNRRTIFILASILGVLILGLFIWMIFFAPKTETFNFGKLSLQQPAVFDSKGDELIFSNGRSFVALNTNNNSSRQLTAPATLPNITKLSIDAARNGAVFQSATNTFDDILAPQIEAKGLSTEEPYWWYVNFDRDEFHLLTDSTGTPVSFNEVKWLPDNSGFVGMTTVDQGTKVSILNADLSERQSYVYPGLITDFVVVGNMLRMLSDDKVVETPIGSTTNPTVLLDKVSSAAFSHNGEWAYISSIIDNQDHTPVYLYSLKDKKKYFEGQAHESVATWTKDDSMVFAPIDVDKGPGFTSIRAIDVKSLRETYINSSKSDIGINFVSHAQNPHTFVAESGQSGFFLASSNKTLTDSLAIKDFASVDIPNGTVEYFPKEGYFIATITGVDTPEARATAEKAIRDKGINPDLVEIQYTFSELLRGAPSN